MGMGKPKWESLAGQIGAHGQTIEPDPHQRKQKTDVEKGKNRTTHLAPGCSSAAEKPSRSIVE
jgi:hypothetical protein